MVIRTRYYTRSEAMRMLDVDSDFLALLEREEIIYVDAQARTSAVFSQQMLERARVAHVLVHDLDVNLAGAAIIVRMREQMQSQRLRVEGFLQELESRLGSGR